MSTLFTTDYAIFKKTKLNRAIDRCNLAKITTSIMSRNLLEYRPIIVNKDMEIVDGQHRLEAAKDLNLPIFYTVNGESKNEDIYLLNVNQKNWTHDDYLNYYCNGGNQNYIQLNNLCKHYNLKVSTSFVFLLGRKDGHHYRKFREGRFIFPDAELDNAKNRYEMFREIQEYIDTKFIGNKVFLSSVRFCEAALAFLKREDVSIIKFMKKLELRVNLLKRCSTCAEYNSILVAIYNFRNPEIIDINPFDSKNEYDLL